MKIKTTAEILKRNDYYCSDCGGFVIIDCHPDMLNDNNDKWVALDGLMGFIDEVGTDLTAEMLKDRLKRGGEK